MRKASAMTITNRPNKRVAILFVMILILGVCYFFYQDDITSHGRLYSSKQKMCTEFAHSYLQTIQKTDNAFSTENTSSDENKRWEMAIAIETDLYNLCMLDLNEDALKKYELNAVGRGGNKQ